MFPLTDLSILFATLLIIAFAFLGLFALFGLFICRRFDRNNNPIPQIPSISASPTPATSPSCLTISDWVTFLTSEKHGLASTYFGFLSVTVALFGIVLVTRATPWMQYLGSILVVGSVIYLIFFGAANRLQQRGKLAKEILDKIMSGDLTNEETIRKQWVDGLKLIKKRKDNE